MALVGVIEAGTLGGVLESVSRAGADALVLCAQQEEAGHVLFKQGTMADASAGSLEGVDAVHELQHWTSGVFTLLRHDREVRSGQPSRGHVLVVGGTAELGNQLEQWLLASSFDTSVTPFAREALEIARQLSPDAVVMRCPRETQGIPCAQFGAALAATSGNPPQLVTLCDAGSRCTLPHESCHSSPLSLNRLSELIDRGVMNNSRNRPTDGHEAQTAPPAVSRTHTIDDDDEPTRRTTRPRALRSLWLPLAVLGAGSALIWLIYALAASFSGT